MFRHIAGDAVVYPEFWKTKCVAGGENFFTYVKDITKITTRICVAWYRNMIIYIHQKHQKKLN